MFQGAVIFPSLGNYGGVVNENYTIAGGQIVERKSALPLIESHKIIPMDIFKVDMISQIMKSVFSDGGVTFMFSDKNRVSNALHTFWKQLKCFKHAASMGYCLDSNSRVPGNMIGLLTFLHLQHCIPVLNPRKVDGFGAVFRVVNPEASAERKSLAESTSLAIAVSNDLDNLFIIDGVRVRDTNMPPSELIGHVVGKMEAKSNASKVSSGGMASPGGNSGTTIEYSTYTSYTYSGSSTSTSTW
jgi:hypothetical protein